MQVISCAENESIEIGVDVSVTVVEIHDDHVRIGITSPTETPSYWEEILYLETNEDDLLLNQTAESLVERGSFEPSLVRNEYHGWQ